MRTLNITLLSIRSKTIPRLLSFSPMINPNWVELPMSRMNVHGLRDVRSIEVLLYIYISYCACAKRHPGFALHLYIYSVVSNDSASGQRRP